jgi:hypothetical protein
MAGDIAAGREVVSLLPGWFMLHIETMDGALAVIALSPQEQS